MTKTSSRVIKRYANRKLYDTLESRYVTLEQIAEMIRRSEEVKVVDNNSKEDLTSVTLAQIIFEEEKKQRSFLPLAALRKIIQSGGDSFYELMSQLSGSAERVGRVFRPEDGEKSESELDDKKTETSVAEKISEWTDPSKLVKDFRESIQSTFDGWQKHLEHSVHQTLESVSPLAPLQKEIQTLRERIGDLEKKLGGLESSPPPDLET